MFQNFNKNLQALFKHVIIKNHQKNEWNQLGSLQQQDQF